MEVRRTKEPYFENRRKWRETETGLAGTREREVRDPTPVGSLPLHPARLEPGPGPSPCQDFLEMLF